MAIKFPPWRGWAFSACWRRVSRKSLLTESGHRRMSTLVLPNTPAMSGDLLQHWVDPFRARKRANEACGKFPLEMSNCLASEIHRWLVFTPPLRSLEDQPMTLHPIDPHLWSVNSVMRGPPSAVNTSRAPQPSSSSRNFLRSRGLLCVVICKDSK